MADAIDNPYPLFVHYLQLVLSAKQGFGFILCINQNTVRINRFILTVTHGYPLDKLIYGKDNFIYPYHKSLFACKLVRRLTAMRIMRNGRVNVFIKP